MATRSNIIVQAGRSKIYLYRHWDGYPAETGADLVEKLLASDRKADKFLIALLTQKRGGEGHDADRAQYELTTNVHGDIEWLYSFTFDERGVVIGWGSRSPGQDPALIEGAARSGKSVSDLINLANSDRASINVRLAARGVEDRYEMLQDPATQLRVNLRALA